MAKAPKGPPGFDKLRASKKKQDIAMGNHIVQRWNHSPNTAQYATHYYAHTQGYTKVKPQREKYGLNGLGGRITAHDIRSGIDRRNYAGGSLDHNFNTSASTHANPKRAPKRRH